MRRATRLSGGAVGDSVFLAIAIVLSLAWYATRLGFYSDDWAFFGPYATATDQTVAGYFNASHSDVHAMRPVQLWLCAVLYRFFGMDPLGYHLFNGLLIVLNPILCYGIARELRVSRTIALPVALVFGLLPSYSTDRLWYLAFAITLSLTACLASIYADLRASVAGMRAGIAWKAGGAAGLLISALAYEVALPLLLVVPFLMVWRMRRDYRPVPRQRIGYLALLTGINIALLAGVVVFKLKTTVRLGAEHGLAAQVLSIARHAVRRQVPEGAYGLNVFSAVRVHFGDYGVTMPESLVTVVPSATAGMLWLTLAFAVATFAYLVVSVRKQPWPAVGEWGAAIVAGIFVFGLGYAIFLTNYNLQFTPTGLANRVAIVASLGAAMCIVGCIGLAVTPLVKSQFALYLFAALITAFASSGFLITNVIAGYWIDAYKAQRAVLAGIRERFPTLPSHSTMILDGVCPYIGPAIVFESHWDLAGALQVMYRDRTIAADVATPRLVVGDAGITTSIYNQRVTYPYGSQLFVYHAGTGAVQPLTDATTARTYFARETSVRRCPPAKEGMGVALF